MRVGTVVTVWAAVGLMACTGGMLSGDQSAAGGAGSLGTDAQAATAAVALASLPIRHLLTREILNSYDDLLGNNISSVVPSGTMQTDAVLGSFDNDVSLQSMSSTRLNGYMAAADLVSQAALTPATAQNVLGCPTATIDGNCIDGFVATFGRRAFRRPLTADEVTAYAGLFATEPNTLDGAKLVLRGLLSAPAFLYEPEIGQSVQGAAGTVRLTQYEVASRLSFTLLGTSPNQALLAMADSNQLGSSDAIAGVASAMLGSSEGKAYLRYFALNWLGLGAAATNGVTGSALDTPQLHADMPEESLRLFDDFAAPGAHFADIYRATYTYVTPSLAAVYGVTAPAANTWAKVDLTGKPRLGLLTTPAVLNITGIATFPAIKRGKYVLETLLCEDAGTPPASASAVVPPADSAGETERQQLAEHAANPSCAGCHNIIDPPGFGFEQYNADGNFLTADSQGRPYTGQGAVVGTGGFSFTGAPALGAQLATMDIAQRCIAQKLAQYLLGRAVTANDAAIVASIDNNLRTTDLPSTMLAFVKSDAFLTRQVN